MITRRSARKKEPKSRARLLAHLRLMHLAAGASRSGKLSAQAKRFRRMVETFRRPDDMGQRRRKGFAGLGLPFLQWAFWHSVDQLLP
jgi:hypothetical protein